MKSTQLLIVVIFLSSCVSNTYLTSKERTSASYIETPVYITNPEHENYSYLIKSEIYTFTTIPDSRYKLTLMDTEYRYACGLGMLLPIYTLGILQANSPADEIFVYKLEGPEGEQLYQHYLSMESKTSIWQFFAKPFVGNENKVRTKALKFSKREPYANELL